MPKEVRIIKRKDKFYVIGKNNNKFGFFETKQEAEYKLQQILTSKSKRNIILNTIEDFSVILKKKGMIHISDALISCANLIAREENKDNIIIGLCKIISLLRNKGESHISEQLNNKIPDILSLEKCGSDKMRMDKNGVTADRVYSMVTKLYEKYIIGLIDHNSFEYQKMKEFKSMLKNGFELPAPDNVKVPDNISNWWEYFSRRSN